ncbi:MAG: D-sedoheptulose 7-phosphate isomerase [Nitrososphaerota archaeon]|nr:D-sedoheptulose 7-phosphate isomerase [Nitrososphaerota archaeon]MDG7049052.1 D-sedoheptulose 7-phosphate isomerase [Nitrososphaerota archaeon]MDG7052116.1 D-sedoheptulose 7-phosphate isomerase [Nitrososphaerota archaeon]
MEASRVAEAVKESAEVKLKVAEDGKLLEKIVKVAGAIVESLKKGGKLVIFGNGGSAADAQHIACELTGRYLKERDSLPAIALTTNTSCLTAIANDYSYDLVFSRQVQGLVTERDTVIGISTSGMSKNVVLGLKAARDKGAFTVAFTGASGGEVCVHADECIKVPSKSTPRIQEVHITIGHIICQLVEESMFP